MSTTINGSINDSDVTARAKEIAGIDTNKHFAEFERNYFIYGIAFMIILPAIPKYLVDYLNMDYSQTFLAKGVISQLGIMLLAPIAGRIFDRQNPAFFAFMTFACLSLYPAILFISTFLLGSVLERQF